MSHDTLSDVATHIASRPPPIASRARSLGILPASTTTATRPSWPMGWRTLSRGADA